MKGRMSLDTFASRLSLYDIISMLIPGGILLFVLGKYFPCLSLCGFSDLENDSNIAIVLFILCPLAYLVGITNHFLSNIIWGAYRNNVYLISSCFNNVKEQLIHTPNLNQLVKGLQMQVNKPNILCSLSQYGFLLCMIIVIFCALLNKIFSLHYLFYTSIVLTTIIGIIWLAFTNCDCLQHNKGNKNIIGKYYQAYYYVQQNANCKDIPIMEGQVAFMQAMAIPLALLAAMPGLCAANTANCYINLLLFLVYVGIYPLVFIRLKKIHSRVWEDYEFLKQIDIENLTPKTK